MDPYPPYVTCGSGQVIVDAEGEERLDFLNNYTSLIHGHADTDVVAAVRRQLEAGSSFGLPTPVEVELAETIVERIPSVEQVRFTNSGTEAVMMAIQAARAYTNRPKIVRFEGAYHGSYDFAASGATVRRGDPNGTQSVVTRYAAGTPDGVVENAIVLPFNDTELMERTLETNRNSIAAVLIDLMPWRMGLINADASFVRRLRDITRNLGMLLIFDEVITLRVSYSGAQSVLGVFPDLTTLGKVIGGGFPIGAVGGRADVMSVFDPRGGHPKVPHGGTFTANPIGMVAGLTTLRKMTPDAFDRINANGDYLREQVSEAIKSAKQPGQVIGRGSLFSISISDEPARDASSWMGSEETRARRSRLYSALLHHGMLLAPHLAGCLSTPMTRADIDAFVEVLYQSLAELRTS
jgi:glutamate-1-semialdehyde 2,1-aminomutase